jgi:dihydrofolate synthase/folylpolyglutamate synthase
MVHSRLAVQPNFELLYLTFMSYSSAIDQLNAMTPELFTQPGQARRKFSLEEIGILLAALGNPHWRFPSVLIAGTNGKGSTASTLAAILIASGQRTGLYTSPHLSRPNERVRINGAEISDDDFAAVYHRVHRCAEQLVEEGKLVQLPSFFEHLTAMAFLHFAGQHIDIAVLEVGMGGRLDATNIVDPLLSVITDISLDHTEWLGPTISAIAREKAGILRHNGTLITLPQHPDANQTIGEVANELGVRAVSAVPYMPQTDPSGSDTFHDAYYVQALGTAIEVASPLHGAHQHRNIALAIAAAVELAFHHSVPITPRSITTGIRNTHWPGRLERVVTSSSKGENATEWLLDVAHNPAGAWALRAAVSNLQRLDEPRRKPTALLFSCLRDKPVNELAHILFPLFDEVIFAPIHSPRATPMPELLAAAAATGTPARTATSIEEALNLAERNEVQQATGVTAGGAPSTRQAQACEITTPSSTTVREAPPAPRAAGRIVISGSVYLVGEARPLILQRAAGKEGAA